MARVLSAPTHSFQAADESGILDPETEFGHPHSRFNTSTTENSVSGSSFVTAPSQDTPSSMPVPLPELDPRIEFPTISDPSLEERSRTSFKKRSQARLTTSLDLPSREDARAGTASPLSNLMVSLDQMQKSGHRSKTLDSAPSSQERRLDATPAIAGGPATPSRALSAHSGRDSLAVTPAWTTISSLSASPPSASQRKRHTFGGSEHGGSGEQHWRGELADVSVPHSNFSSSRSHARDSSRSVDLSEIESNVAAVEQALRQHTVSGSFDPSSVRRRFTPSEATHAAANSNSSAPHNSLVSSPDEQAPSMIHQSSFQSTPSRVVLPPGSHREIEAAVTQVRRAISSSQLQREKETAEREAQSSNGIVNRGSNDVSEQQLNADGSIARETTPARAARVRGVSMREVEDAYKRMTEVVSAAAGLTPSPAVDRGVFSIPTDAHPRRRSTQAAPAPRQLFNISSEDSRERERTRSAGAISLPSRPGKAVPGRFRHGYSRSGSGVPSVASLMGMPASHSAEATTTHLRGRSSSTSMGSKRAASESPVRPQRHMAHQPAELAKELQFALRAASRPSEHAERRSASPSPPPAPLLLRTSVSGPPPTQQNGQRTSMETAGGGSGHSRSVSGGAGGTSPSATAKTQGTPRSLATDRGNLRNSSEWEDHAAVEQSHRRTGSRVNEADAARTRRQSMGLEGSTSGFEARPLTLNNHSQPRKTNTIDERFGSRSHFNGQSDSMRSANSRRSPTPLAPYRESNSMQDWASATALAPRPVSRSSAGAGPYGAASRFSKRQSMGGYDSSRSHTLGREPSEAETAASESQRRHELERDSLLDSLQKLRQSLDDARSQLHDEVTRTLELNRELQRREAREAQFQEQQAEYENRIQEYQSQLEDSVLERHQLIEEVQNLRNQLARKSTDHNGRDMDTSSELDYPRSLDFGTSIDDSPQRNVPVQPLTRRALGSTSQQGSRPTSGGSGAGASSRANASTRPGSGGDSSHYPQCYPSALGFQARGREPEWNEEERSPEERRRESSSEEESLGGGIMTKWSQDQAEMEGLRRSMEEGDLMQEPLPLMDDVDDAYDDEQDAGSIPDEEASSSHPTPPPSRIPTSPSRIPTSPSGISSMIQSSTSRSTIGGSRRVPSALPSNPSIQSRMGHRYSTSGIPQSTSRILSAATSTSAGGSSFTAPSAQSESPIGSYIHRFNGKEGFWDERRPAGKFKNRPLLPLPPPRNG